METKAQIMTPPPIMRVCFEYSPLDNTLIFIMQSATCILKLVSQFTGSNYFAFVTSDVN
jgi:hypothetical protein